MGDNNWQSVLRSEFAAEEGSFLLGLRTELKWDGAAFSRLTNAMVACCRSEAELDVLERWVAEGFWFADTFVRRWTNHEAWKERPERVEIDAGVELLSCLAHWFFFGDSPWIDGLGPYD